MSRHAKAEPVDEPDEITPGANVKIFGREPALWLAAIAAAVSLGSQFIWHLSDEQQSIINAAAAALVGLLTALSVDEEQTVPAILGLISALVALGMGFGWHLDPTDQAVIMSAAATIVAMFVRTQVTVNSPHYADDEEVPA